MPVQTKIQFRRSIATDWVAVNPILSAGEVGYETDNKKFKIGDGTTAWNSLAYAAVLPSELNELVDDRVNDLLVAGSNIEKSYSDSTNALTISVTGVSLPGHTHSSSAITDFNSSVSGLLPVKNIVAGTNIAVSGNDGTFTISTNGLDTNAVKDVIGATITGVSGIRASYDDVGKIETISVTGLTSSYIGDFNTSVSGLLGVKSLVQGTGIGIVNTSGNQTISVTGIPTSLITNFASGVNALIDNAVSASIVGGSGVGIVYDSGTNTLTVSSPLTAGSGISLSHNSGNYVVSLSDPTIQSTDVTDFNSAVSGLVSGIYAPLNSPTFTGTVNGISKSMVGLGNVDNTSDADKPISNATQSGLDLKASLTGATFTGSVTIPSGTGNFNTLNVNNTPVSLSGHTHVWSNISDASAIASLGELAYLSGVSAGTASAGRAIVVDSNKSIASINSITTTGNITVGGNLVVQGTTTTVNSTTVEIGDNIIRVNASGLNTGGIEVYTGSDTKSLVWNTSANRWEFTGDSIYTSGNFIGSLSGNAATVTNGVYTTDSGTVTSTMIANNTIVNDDINSSASIAYSKLNLSNSIVNADISSSAAIAVSKLASSGLTIGSTTINLGSSTSTLAGLASISGTSAGSPTTLFNCVIDGGTP
jgi:hypothetical protein